MEKWKGWIFKIECGGHAFKKMTLVGGSSERFSTHRVDGLNISKVKWRPKRACAFSNEWR